MFAPPAIFGLEPLLSLIEQDDLHYPPVVHAIDAATGKAAWTFATRARVDSSPVVSGGRVYIGSGDGRLYVFGLVGGR